MATILISYDIDGTLEVGDPPGPLTMDMVRMTRREGFVIGSFSDRPPSAQRRIWAENGIEVDFVLPKRVDMLAELKTKYAAERYYHIGDREDLDKRYAERAEFEFLWPDEAMGMEWYRGG